MSLLGTIQEAFTGTATPTGWVETDITATSFTYDRTGVSINLPAATTSATDGDLNFTATNDLTGSFARVNILGVSGVGATHTDNVFRVRQNATNYYTIFYEAGTLFFSKVVAGVQTNIASTTFNPTLHVWWQIRHKGASVYGETSTDGINWVNPFGTTSHADPTAITITAVDILIGAICFGVDISPAPFKFKYFNYPLPGTTTSTSSTSASTTSASTSSTSASTSSTSFSSTSASTSTSSTSSSISSTSNSTSSTSASTSSTSQSSTSSSTSTSSTSSSISSTSFSSTSQSSTSSSTSISSTSSSISSTSSSISSTSASTSSTSFSSTSSSSSTSTTAIPTNLIYSYQDFATIVPDRSNSATTTTTSPITWSHTVGRGDNRMLIVAPVLQGNSQPTATAVTFNGVPLTKIRADQGNNVGAGWFDETSIWALANPPVGTFSVSVTATVPTNPDLSGASMSYFNCEQVSTADSSNGTSQSVAGLISTSLNIVEQSSIVVSVLNYLNDEAANGKSTTTDITRQTQSMSIGLNGTLTTADTGTSVPSGTRPVSYIAKAGAGTTFLSTMSAASFSPSIASNTDDVDIDTSRNDQNIAVDDGDYFIQYGSKTMLQEYKKKWTNNTDNPTFTWKGRTTLATTISPLLIQIYNISTAAWENLVRETQVPADTDFTRTVTQSTNVSNYYDSNNIVTFRVYQRVN